MVVMKMKRMLGMVLPILALLGIVATYSYYPWGILILVLIGLIYRLYLYANRHRLN